MRLSKFGISEIKLNFHLFCCRADKVLWKASNTWDPSAWRLYCGNFESWGMNCVERVTGVGKEKCAHCAVTNWLVDFVVVFGQVCLFLLITWFNLITCTKRATRRMSYESNLSYSFAFDICKTFHSFGKPPCSTIKWRSYISRHTDKRQGRGCWGFQ